MASCYGNVEEEEKSSFKFNYLPLSTNLKNGKEVVLDVFDESDHLVGMEMLNEVLREGQAWPFENELNAEGFKGYFLSHAAFTVKEKHGAQNVVGIFYIKPNFPGRCSHICNGGFVTNKEYRGLGVATFMGKAFLRMAKDLGYKMAYFNLVFDSNKVSIQLWENLGFQRIVTVPKAARLKGIPYLVDAHQYIYDLTGREDNHDANKRQQQRYKPLVFKKIFSNSKWSNTAIAIAAISGVVVGTIIGGVCQSRQKYQR
mmetsp:Transcript_2407/g.3398  ORF Transcript_2407/g.3398 Transcript_2407/m.3398 type:complete len:257 (-) Transcript_2407:153-923(-)